MNNRLLRILQNQHDMHIKGANNRHSFKTMNQRGCRIWNSMPADLKQITSKSSFGKKYKNANAKTSHCMQKGGLGAGI